MEDVGVDGRIILKYVLNKLDGKEWSGLADCKRNNWRDFVNKVMNFLDSKNLITFLTV